MKPYPSKNSDVHVQLPEDHQQVHTSSNENLTDKSLKLSPIVDAIDEYPDKTRPTTPDSTVYPLDHLPSIEYFRQIQRTLSSCDSEAPSCYYLTEHEIHKTYQIVHEPKCKCCTKFKNIAKNFREKCFTDSSVWKKYFRKNIPLIDIVQHYRLHDLPYDIAAGLSVGVAAIPIGMSYAIMAGFRPEYGLYCQLFFPIIYFFLGTGRQVCIGANGVEALMTFDALSAVLGRNASAEEWLNTGTCFAFCVGICLILMRCTRLGLLANFLADPVVSGFSTGCAVIIATSQLHYFFGISTPRLTQVPRIIIYLCQHITEIRWECVTVGLGSLMQLIFFSFISRQYFNFPLPGSLFVVLVFTPLAYFLSPIVNIPVIGPIPQGLPYPKLFHFQSFSVFLEIMKQAAIYSVVYFMMHSSIAKAVARNKCFRVDLNQELLATGICSLFGSMVQCYPVATSLARTSIARASGAETQCYNLINTVTIITILSILTKYLYYLPMATLSSIVLYGVYHMMNFKEAIDTARLLNIDSILWIVCFLTTVLFGAVYGIVISIIVSLMWLLKKNAFPSVEVLGRLPGTNVYRNILVYPEAQELSGIKILRIDAPLNFSNIDVFESTLLQFANHNRVTSATESQKRTCKSVLNVVQKSPSKILSETDDTTVKEMELIDNNEAVRCVNYILLDGSSWTFIDSTAIRVLDSVIKQLLKSNIHLLFYNWTGKISLSQFFAVVPPEKCFLTAQDALLWINRIHTQKNA